MSGKVLVVYREPSEAGPYKTAVEAAGMRPELVVAGSSVRVADYAGLLLTGGDDVDPALYGEAPHPETEVPDRERDSMELRLIQEALELDRPLLAICRGLQILNVYHNGSLIQHLDQHLRHRQTTPDKSLPAHDAVADRDTLLASIAGLRLAVNSRHHQAVARLGAGLHVSARDPEDGIIEALERRDRRFVVGVQWHPEDQVFRHAAQLQLFRAFGSCCARP